MEDSGIDSEDKQSTFCDDALQNSPAKSPSTATAAAAQHMVSDLDVVFRSSSNNSHGSTNVIQRQPGLSFTQDSTSTTTPTTSDDSHTTRLQPPNTCRILQRKLELKVERAKRNYSHYREEQAKKSQFGTLLPINRLTIPGDTEQKPLVDYKSEESDENEEISFFPAKRKCPKTLRNAELTDTFSIQEMTIESDDDERNSDDSDGSQNLELLPPLKKSNLFERLKSCFTSCTSNVLS